MTEKNKSKFDAKQIPSDLLIKQIVDAYNEGLTTKQVAERVGCTTNMLSVWKLLIHSYIKADWKTDRVFRATTHNANDKLYEQFIQKWELNNKNYWNGKPNIPNNKVSAMLISEYGTQKASDILTAWALLRDKSGHLFRFLREEVA